MKKALLLLCCSMLSTFALIAQSKQPARTNMPDNKPANTTPDSLNNPVATEVATLGGGCFWCIEAVLQDLKGVVKVESGYSGGTVVNPSYREVCTGTTGHAEVVQVTFEPSVISYHDLLEIFFAFHDPTTLNRQGNDVGTQYRSVVFYHSEEQRQVAEAVKAEIQKELDAPVVTEISPARTFYKAETYHQNYYKDNTYQPYCAYVISPKVKKLREKYRDRLKD